jgi:hypothetical protein
MLYMLGIGSCHILAGAERSLMPAPLVLVAIYFCLLVVAGCYYLPCSRGSKLSGWWLLLFASSVVAAFLNCFRAGSA